MMDMKMKMRIDAMMEIRMNRRMKMMKTTKMAMTMTTITMTMTTKTTTAMTITMFPLNLCLFGICIFCRLTRNGLMQFGYSQQEYACTKPEHAAEYIGSVHDSPNIAFHLSHFPKPPVYLIALATPNTYANSIVHVP